MICIEINHEKPETGMNLCVFHSPLAMDVLEVKVRRRARSQDDEHDDAFHASVQVHCRSSTLAAFAEYCDAATFISGISSKGRDREVIYAMTIC